MSERARISVYAEPMTEARAVVDLVRREAREECPTNHRLAGALDAGIERAVSELWESRVKTYVPLLALRRVRCCLRSGTCDCGEC